MKCLGLLAVAVLLFGCGVRGPSRPTADNRTVSLDGLSLQVPQGWSSYADDIGGWSPEPSLWAANIPLHGNAAQTHSPEALPYQVLPHLPADGIVLQVDALREGTCPRTPRLHVEPDNILSSSYEGQPAPHVSNVSLYATRQGRCLFAQAWFGVNRPGEAMLAKVNGVLASVEVEPELPPGSETGWKTYRDEKARVSLRYPPGWNVARERLMPLLTEPHELVSLGTAPLHPTGKGCPQVPEDAVDALGPKDALISLLEYESAGSAPARPRHFLPFEGARPGTCRQLHLPPGFLFRVRNFEDHGRLFQLYVAIGESATSETGRQTAEILDSLAFD